MLVPSKRDRKGLRYVVGQLHCIDLALTLGTGSMY